MRAMQGIQCEIFIIDNLQHVLAPAFLISFPIWKTKKVSTPIRVAISKHHLTKNVLERWL